MSLLSSKKKAKKSKGKPEATPAFNESSADEPVKNPTARSRVVLKRAEPKVKLPPDTYTLILLIAWIFLTTACVLLYLDVASYK